GCRNDHRKPLRDVPAHARGRLRPGLALPAVRAVPRRRPLSQIPASAGAPLRRLRGQGRGKTANAAGRRDGLSGHSRGGDGTGERMRYVKAVLRWLAGVGLAVQGVNHFARADFFVRIMPPYLPWHLELVWLSGVCEVVLGVLLLVPRVSAWTAWGVV